jgi:hypothetical protein
MKKCCKKKFLLKEFQDALESIPLWNTNIVENEYSRFKFATHCNWLENLIKVAFIELSDLISKGCIPSDDLNIPKGDVFVHKCYINIAREMWRKPQLFYHEYSTIEKKCNEEEVHSIIERVIGETIRNELPLQNIVDTFLHKNEEMKKEEQIEVIHKGGSYATTQMPCKEDTKNVNDNADTIHTVNTIHTADSDDTTDSDDTIYTPDTIDTIDTPDSDDTIYTPDTIDTPDTVDTTDSDDTILNDTVDIGDVVEDDVGGVVEDDDTVDIGGVVEEDDTVDIGGVVEGGEEDDDNIDSVVNVCKLNAKVIHTDENDTNTNVFNNIMKSGDGEGEGEGEGEDVEHDDFDIDFINLNDQEIEEHQVKVKDDVIKNKHETNLENIRNILGSSELSFTDFKRKKEKSKNLRYVEVYNV